MKIKLIPLLLTTCLTACNQKDFVINSKVFCFDTFVEIKLFEGEQSQVTELEKIFKHFDELSDNYLSREVTNVYTLNHTNDDTQIDKDLYDLLKLSFEVKDQGADCFNPLCGSLAKLWKESLKNLQIPAENVINDAILKINNSDVEFKDGNVVKRIGDAEIDLGGIVKGYALDKCYEYLKDNNIGKYLLNAGSSSILLGEKNSKDGFFSVGLKDLPNAYLKLKNCFVSTSGVKEQGVTIDGVTYSHIIDPHTGSAINENDAVIVISDKGYYGDAMSTSLMMNNIDEIKQIEQEHNIKVIVVKDNSIKYCNESIEVSYH